MPTKRDELKAAPEIGDGADKATLAIRLRQWLSQQRTFPSIAQMARSVGIAESTLRDYFIGRALPSPKNLDILRKVTQLDVLDRVLQTQANRRRARPKVAVSRDVKKLLGRLGAVKKGFAALVEEFQLLVKDAARHPLAYPVEPVDETPTARSRRVAELLDRLSGELGFFKAGSEEDRQAFREAIPGEQLGYLVSLLKALYDEDTFREWLHFTQLDLREKR
jgi:hypothetical protein